MGKPRPNPKPIVPKPGDMISLWFRRSPRHKWVLEHSFVRVLKITHCGGDRYDLVFQDSNTWCDGRGPTMCMVEEKNPFTARGMSGRRMCTPVFGWPGEEGGP